MFVFFQLLNTLNKYNKTVYFKSSCRYQSHQHFCRRCYQYFRTELYPKVITRRNDIGPIFLLLIIINISTSENNERTTRKTTGIILFVPFFYFA